MRPQYNPTDVSINQLVIKFLNGVEVFNVKRQSPPLEIAEDGKFTKIEFEVELDAGECRDWRIRKHLKAHNSVAYTVTASCKLSSDGYITVWPGSIAFKCINHNSRRPALKKLEPLIAKPVVLGYRILGTRTNQSRRKTA